MCPGGALLPTDPGWAHAGQKGTLQLTCMGDGAGLARPRPFSPNTEISAYAHTPLTPRLLKRRGLGLLVDTPELGEVSEGPSGWCPDSLANRATVM